MTPPAMEVAAPAITSDQGLSPKRGLHQVNSESLDVLATEKAVFLEDIANVNENLRMDDVVDDTCMEGKYHSGHYG